MSATRSFSPPAIFIESDLDKVTGVGSAIRTVASERLRAHGGEAFHDATIAYELTDAVLSRGQLFTWKSYLQIGEDRVPLLSASAPRRYDHAAIASSWIGCRFFGHWLMDDLPRQIAAAEIASPVSVLTNPTAGQAGYIAALGLETDTLSDATFARVIVIDDYAQNAYKRQRFDHLRSIARTRFGGGSSKRVMLLRGITGKRRSLVNEEALSAVLANHGFTIIDPAACSAEHILRTCVNAEIILGVEGSQLLNGVAWMREGGAVIVLQPPNRFELIIKDYCDCLGINYAFVVGEAVGENDFSVETSAVLRMIDKIEGATAMY